MYNDIVIITKNSMIMKTLKNFIIALILSLCFVVLGYAQNVNSFGDYENPCKFFQATEQKPHYKDLLYKTLIKKQDFELCESSLFIDVSLYWFLEKPFEVSKGVFVAYFDKNEMNYYKIVIYKSNGEIKGVDIYTTKDVYTSYK